MEKNITANRTHHIAATLITAITIMIKLSPSVLSTSTRNLPLPPSSLHHRSSPSPSITTFTIDNRLHHHHHPFTIDHHHRS
jgi:hypothetical protein